MCEVGGRQLEDERKVTGAPETEGEPERKGPGERFGVGRRGLGEVGGGAERVYPSDPVADIGEPVKARVAAPDPHVVLGPARQPKPERVPDRVRRVGGVVRVSGLVSARVKRFRPGPYARDPVACRTGGAPGLVAEVGDGQRVRNLPA